MAQPVARVTRTRLTQKKTLLKRAQKTPRAPKDVRFTKLGLKITPLLKPYANRISVFGSYARGEETAQSDIDLLIALKPAEARPALGLFDFIKLEQALEKTLGREVDLITEEEINPRRRSNVEKDKVILYEE